MSIPNAAGERPQQDPAQAVDVPAGEVQAPEAVDAPHPSLPGSEPTVAESEAPEPEEGTVHEPVVVETKQEVTIQRSVRYGRIIVVAAVLGAVIAALSAVFFPVVPEANYTLGQIAGFVALWGGAAGLFVGAVISLILGAVARRTRGGGVAIQSDVR